jgi:hypothetical protein
LQRQWKLITGTSGGTAKWSGPLYPKVPATGPISVFCGAGCLFDVVQDPFERNNLAFEQPAILHAMQQRLVNLTATIWSPTYPNVSSTSVCARTAANGGYLTPSDWTPPTMASK